MANSPLDLIAVEVRADIDKLQQGMSGASRVVDASYRQINQASQDSERTIVRAATNSAAAMDNSGYRARALGQQFSQMGQQIAAGTSPLQAIAIQLPDIAVAMGSVGAEAGSLAAFFGGPWGIALTTAAALAASFIPELLGIGDAADEVRPKVDRVASAIERLRSGSGPATRVDVGDLQGKIFEAQGTVARLENTRRLAGQSIGTAFGVDKIDQQIRDARKTLGDLQGLLSASKIRLDVQDTAEANDKAADAAERARRKAESEANAAARKAKAEAERRAKEAQRQQENYNTTKAQLELEQRLGELRGQGTESAKLLADMLEARFRLEQRFPELAKSTRAEDQKRLQVLLDIQNAVLGEAYQRKAVEQAAKEAREAAREAAEDDLKRATKDIDDIQRRQEKQIRTLAGLYQDAFRGGTDAIWQDFKSLGLQVVSEVLARFTLAKIAGGSFDLAGTITSVLGAATGFGGARAIGGPVQAGKPYMVGENGREMFVPQQAGNIVPNYLLKSGGAQQRITVLVQANDYFDARVDQRAGAVATPIARQHSAQASQMAYSQSLRDAPGAVRRAQRFRTT